MVNIQHQADLAKKSLDKQRKFESGWYEKRITRLEEKLKEAEAAAKHWEETCEAQWEEKNEWQDKFVACEEKLQFSHDNNKILNKNLVLKFEECDALKRSAELLAALEAAGVDNWEWYGDATKEFYSNE